MGRKRDPLAFALPLALLLGACPAAAQPAPSAVQTRQAPVPRELAQVLAAKSYALARDALVAGHERMVADVIALTEVPAPPFGEEQRGKAYAALLREAGLADVTIDAIGNVIATRKGADPKAAPLIVAAHLDTVFPAGTDVKVRREGTRLMAQGIGDDSRGLAVLLAVIRAMDKAGVKTARDIVFIGNVGEEGQGDLRGMRHFFANDPRAKSAAGFITVDGAGLGEITVRGVGSRRYRLVFSGPGGHSFNRFGIVNPMAALAATVTGLYTIPVPQRPRTTYSASVVGGGTSVNTIPPEVFLEVDIRSESAAEIERIDAALHDIAARAVEAENAARSTATGRVSVAFKPIGDRPAGHTAEEATLARIAFAAAQQAGYAPFFGAQSTDANVPMSLGVPAVGIRSGGRGGDAHAPSEWIDVAEPDSSRGAAVVLATVLASAGLKP